MTTLDARPRSADAPLPLTHAAAAALGAGPGRRRWRLAVAGLLAVLAGWGIAAFVVAGRGGLPRRAARSGPSCVEGRRGADRPADDLPGLGGVRRRAGPAGLADLDRCSTTACAVINVDVPHLRHAQRRRRRAGRHLPRDHRHPAGHAGRGDHLGADRPVLTAIYLVEYGKGQRLARWITFLVDVMTGIPSIVAGLFALALFVLIFGPAIRLGFGGSVALSLLMIPIVVRSTEEMLRLVPDDLREASYALGVPEVAHDREGRAARPRSAASSPASCSRSPG